MAQLPHVLAAGGTAATPRGLISLTGCCYITGSISDLQFLVVTCHVAGNAVSCKRICLRAEVCCCVWTLGICNLCRIRAVLPAGWHVRGLQRSCQCLRQQRVKPFCVTAAHGCRGQQLRSRCVAQHGVVSISCANPTQQLLL
jgi:hypothetical protein